MWLAMHFGVETFYSLKLYHVINAEEFFLEFEDMSVCSYMSNMNYNRLLFVIMCGGCVCMWLICVFIHVCVLV